MNMLFNVNSATIQKDIASLIYLLRIKYGNLNKDVNEYIEGLEYKYALEENEGKTIE